MKPAQSKSPSDRVTLRCSRRTFLQQGSLWLTVSSLGSVGLWAGESSAETPAVRLGLMTDLHYADRATAGTRHYRQTPAKLAQAAKEFVRARVDLVVELGDLADVGTSREAEKRCLAEIVRQYLAIPGKHLFVLGNHCVETRTKAQFLAAAGQERSYFSFDLQGYHFVVLDACFRSDGTPYAAGNFKWTDSFIPRQEQEWLQADLAANRLPTIAFVHQRIDRLPPEGIGNAAEIRAILEKSGQVRAVFQGHHHRNDHQEIGGIHYCTSPAMVDGPTTEHNAFAVVDLFGDGRIRVTGFGRQLSYEWAGGKSKYAKEK